MDGLREELYIEKKFSIGRLVNWAGHVGRINEDRRPKRHVLQKGRRPCLRWDCIERARTGEWLEDGMAETCSQPHP